jgi:hypothetical protein
VTIEFAGRLAELDEKNSTLGGEILREMGDMLSGSPSFELSFGAFAHGLGFFNYFGFYPLLAPFEGRWVEMKTDVLGDAPEPDASFYDVTLYLPAGLMAAVPGKVVSTARMGDAQVFHVLGPGFRHFSFAFGDFMRLKGGRDGVDVEVYVRKGLAKEATELMATASAAVSFFQKHIHPYPNRRFSVVETPLSMGVAGLEASGLVYVSKMLVESPKGAWGNLFKTGLSQILPFVVAHETAHEWWAHLVGNSTWQAPFLDEALANEYALYFLEQHQPMNYCTNLCGNIFATYALVRSLGSADAPVSTPAQAFGNDIYGYVGIVYAKGGYMMELLRHAMGDQEFDKRIQGYARRFAFRKAGARDLKRALAPDGRFAQIYNRFIKGKTGDQEICPPGFLFLGTCMNGCMDGCLSSPRGFWKSRGTMKNDSQK